MGSWEQLIGFFGRVLGNLTDAANPNGSLHAKISNLINGVMIKQVVPSSNLKFSAPTVRSTTSTSPVLLKRIYINVTGVIRVSFDAICGNAYAQIYRNGSAYGTLRAVTNGGSYTTFTEDLFFANGDAIELYAWSVSGATISVKNFNVYYDLKSSPSDGGVSID